VSEDLYPWEEQVDLENAKVRTELNCVRAPDIGCFAPEECWALGFCGFTREETKRRLMRQPDPKPVPRIKDPKAVARKRKRDGRCRCGCGRPATDGHHIFPRSLGGDDVEANAMGLFHDCHMILEFGPDRDEMAKLLGERLRDEEIQYVLGKRGPEAGREFLARYYGVDQPEQEGAE
jgi:5-methylcytosine-specific restriction endonuclease McrA